MYCKNCKCNVQEDHVCYQKNYTIPDDYKRKFVFYDFEAVQGHVQKNCINGYQPTCINGCDKEECTPDELCYTCFICQNCKQSSCGRITHTPNLVIAHTICDNCTIDDPYCVQCGQLCDLPNHKPCGRKL